MNDEYQLYEKDFLRVKIPSTSKKQLKVKIPLKRKISEQKNKGIKY